MWIVFIVILINLGYSALFPNIEPFKPLLKQMAVQSMTNVESSTKYPYCGEYESICETSGSIDSNLGAKMYSQRGKNPKKVGLHITTYQKLSNCKGPIKMRLYEKADLEYKGDNKYRVMYTDVKLTLDEEFIKIYNCTTVKPGKEFSVKKVQCFIDGEDQMEGFRNIIGDDDDDSFLFNENSLLLDEQHMNRISDKGCQMSTFSIILIVVVAIIVVIVIIVTIIKLSKIKTIKKNTAIISN